VLSFKVAAAAARPREKAALGARQGPFTSNFRHGLATEFSTVDAGEPASRAYAAIRFML
jgi:hypothetical protein